MNDPQAQKQSFYRKLRSQLLPVKPQDTPFVKLGKNMAFMVLLVLLGIVTGALLIGVAFAL